MTSFQVKDIKGIALKKKVAFDPRMCPPTEYVAYNDGIREQQSVRIKFNAEELLDLLNTIELEDEKGEAFSLKYAIGGDNTKLIRDAIIAEGHTLLEKAEQ